MGWHSAEALFDEATPKAVWDRSELERLLYSENHARTGSTEARNAEISRLFVRGEDVEDIARRFNLLPRTIRRILGL